MYGSTSKTLVFRQSFWLADGNYFWKVYKSCLGIILDLYNDTGNFGNRLIIGKIQLTFVGSLVVDLCMCHLNSVALAQFKYYGFLDQIGNICYNLVTSHKKMANYIITFWFILSQQGQKFLRNAYISISMKTQQTPSSDHYVVRLKAPEQLLNCFQAYHNM